MSYETIKETLKNMEEQNLVISRVFPSGESCVIEFKEEKNGV